MDEFYIKFWQDTETGEMITVKSESSEDNYTKNIYRRLFAIMCESCNLDKELYKSGEQKCGRN